MYSFVYLIQKKKTGNPTWSCRGCKVSFVGGPQRIRAHHSNELGATKCPRPPAGAEEAAAVHFAKEREEKAKKEAARKRKADAEEAARKAKSKKQAVLTGMTTSDLTHGDVDQAWAEAVYAIPLSLNVMENPLFLKAARLTSTVNLSQSVRNSPDAPTYEPPTRHRLGKPLLAATVATSTEQVAAAQAVEAAKYGVTGSSDGWGSNPQHRPIQAMILETPSTAAMIEAEDLSGFVKSAYFVSGKLLEWSDARLALMKLPPSTMDYLCVDGAELDTAKKAMEARPYLSAGLCTPHSLDLEVEDISKLTWVAKHMAEMKRVVKFLRGHGYSLFLWREKSKLELLLPAETRFATNFIMCERLQKEKPAAIEVVYP